MTLELYQIDAFTDTVLTGNAAAVCPLEHWLDDELLQNIAAENNLSETCFFVPVEKEYHIRWFTPEVEVDLCGHATLAAAHVLYCHLGSEAPELVFHSRSGELRVSRTGDFYVLDFPCDEVREVALTQELLAPFITAPVAAYKGKSDYMLVFDREQTVAMLKPDMALLAKIKARGIIVTAKGDTVDFVSRFFAPQSGVDEDPVTGSAHTTLTPFWSAQLGKKKLNARQISRRGGYLLCENRGERVAISGQAVTYLVGTVTL